MTVSLQPEHLQRVHEAAQANRKAGAWVVTPDMLNGSQTAAQALTEAASGNTGAMIALYPHGSTARKLALLGKDDEPPEQLHLTLAFLGDANKISDPDGLQQTVADWADSTPPLDGEISGQGVFTAGEKPVSVLLPDLPGLPAARENLVSKLKAGGHPVSEKHGFTPHITTSYSDHASPDLGGHKLRFTHARLVLGDEHRSFRLGG